MKRASFRVHPDKGWIRTTLSPLNEKHDPNFGLMDVIMFAALVFGVAAVARLFLAH